MKKKTDFSSSWRAAQNVILRCTSRNALSFPEKQKDTYLRLRQGHRHIPYAPNLISVMTVKSDKWQQAHRAEGSHHQTCGRHPASHTQTAPEMIHMARLSLLRVPSAQYERVSVTPAFLIETLEGSSQCPQQTDSSNFTGRILQTLGTYKHRFFQHAVARKWSFCNRERN